MFYYYDDDYDNKKDPPPPTNKQVLAMLGLGGLFFYLTGVDREVREERKRVRGEERKAKEEEEEEGREKNDESPLRTPNLLLIYSLCQRVHTQPSTSVVSSRNRI